MSPALEQHMPRALPAVTPALRGFGATASPAPLPHRGGPSRVAAGGIRGAICAQLGAAGEDTPDGQAASTVKRRIGRRMHASLGCLWGSAPDDPHKRSNSGSWRGAMRQASPVSSVGVVLSNP